MAKSTLNRAATRIFNGLAKIGKIILSSILFVVVFLPIMIIRALFTGLFSLIKNVASRFIRANPTQVKNQQEAIQAFLSPDLKKMIEMLNKLGEVAKSREHAVFVVAAEAWISMLNELSEGLPKSKSLYDFNQSLKLKQCLQGLIEDIVRKICMDVKEQVPPAQKLAFYEAYLKTVESFLEQDKNNPTLLLEKITIETERDALMMEENFLREQAAKTYSAADPITPRYTTQYGVLPFIRTRHSELQKTLKHVTQVAPQLLTKTEVKASHTNAQTILNTLNEAILAKDTNKAKIQLGLANTAIQNLHAAVSPPKTSSKPKL